MMDNQLPNNQTPNSRLADIPSLPINQILSQIHNLTNFSLTSIQLYRIICAEDRLRRVMNIRRLSSEDNPPVSETLGCITEPYLLSGVH